MVRKMELKQQLLQILEGIDLQDCDSDEVEGWWETSTGAKFGKGILDRVLEVAEGKDQELSSLQAKYESLEAEKNHILQAVANAEDLFTGIRCDDAPQSKYHQLKQAFEDLLGRFCKLNEEHTGRHRNIKQSWLKKAGLDNN